MWSEKVLLVDDEPMLLKGLRRHLHGDFEVELATSGQEALKIIGGADDFAVIVSDFRMPIMNGVELLRQVEDKSPNTVRMMLTGNTDLETTVQAINEGRIFRFMNKPCSAETLKRNLAAGIEQYRLITAEKDLLEKTLKGSIGILTEILSLVHPEAFGHASRLRDAIGRISVGLGIPEVWEMEAAAMLSPIGFVTLPPALTARTVAGEDLTDAELEMLAEVPAIGHRLLESIPRLESVAGIVRYLNVSYEDESDKARSEENEYILTRARMLHAVSDLVEHERGGLNTADSLLEMRTLEGVYDPEALNRLHRVLLSGETFPLVETVAMDVTVQDLRVDDILQVAAKTVDGRLLLSAGNRVNQALREKISNFHRLVGVMEPLRIERAVGE